jgi:hypothetical protein
MFIRGDSKGAMAEMVQNTLHVNQPNNLQKTNEQANVQTTRNNTKPNGDKQVKQAKTENSLPSNPHLHVSPVLSHDAALEYGHARVQVTVAIAEDFFTNEMVGLRRSVRDRFHAATERKEFHFR